MTKKQLENKYILARREYENQRFGDALAYYKEILNEEPNSYEAVFRVIICKANISTLASFDETYHSLAFEARKVFSFESFKNLNEIEKKYAVKDMERDFTNTIITCEKAISNHYVEFQSLPNKLSEFRGQLIKLYTACGCFGESIYENFTNEEIKKICVTPLKNSIALLKKSAMGLPNSVFEATKYELARYTSKIKEFEPDYVNPCYEKTSSQNKYQGNINVQQDKPSSVGGCIVFAIVAVLVALAIYMMFN